jgi:hypothetical protein
MTLNNTEVEAFIREAFAENFEILRFEGGHSLNPAVKEAALQQVLLYWRKLGDIAQKVSETEVKLNLPAQTTPQGRKFGIEGVVDIVREDDRIIMYDIKSHDVDYVRANTTFYEQQLNVYAYIWEKLRNLPLDQTAIIATDFPEAVNEALTGGEEHKLAAALQAWDPVVELDFNHEQVEATIADFGRVVDAIVDGQFDPPPAKKLTTRLKGAKTLYATRICRNCDVRFFCDSYREYALKSDQAKISENFQRYYQDFGDELDRERWRTLNLDAATTTDNLDGLSLLS